MSLRVPISGMGRTWPAVTLRQPAAGALDGIEDYVAVSRHASVPTMATIDMHPDDLAAAMAWLRAVQA